MARDFVTAQTDNMRLALQYEEFGHRYCGNIEARLVDRSIRSHSVGYNTAPWARGLGLQNRALELMSEYCFRNGVHRLEIRAAISNGASRYVAEAAGYQIERIMRQGENIKGKLHDVSAYARLSKNLAN